MKNTSLAQTPPMGCNSWNAFRCDELTEKVVLGMADAMVESGMRDAGYESLLVDDCWQAFARDESGRLHSHPARFPSGMAALGEQIHARGLKYGPYLSPGRKTCAMLYDKYPARDIGSFDHEQLDIATFAEWGVDYLKLLSVSQHPLDKGAPLAANGAHLEDVWSGEAVSDRTRLRLEPHEMLVFRSDAR